MAAIPSGRAGNRERREGCPRCSGCPGAPASPAASALARPRAPCPVSLRCHSPAGRIPRVLTPPVASCPPCPRGCPAPQPRPPHSPQPRGPAAPGPVPGYPLTARSKELGWARRLLPGLTPGLGAAWPGRAPCQPRKGQPGDFPPGKNKPWSRDNESRNQTLTPPQEMLPKENQSKAHVACEAPGA